jgi:Glycosyl transferases group 1
LSRSSEIGDHEKRAFYGEAIALLCPTDWPEPFGLVITEAIANATPVIAFRRGAVPEIIDDSVTGFIVENIDEAVAAVPRAKALDRPAIRRHFEDRFSVERMTRDYIALSSEILRHSAVSPILNPIPESRPVGPGPSGSCDRMQAPSIRLSYPQCKLVNSTCLRAFRNRPEIAHVRAICQ